MNTAIASCLVVGTVARAEPVGLTGLESLLWPAVVVAAPFGLLHRLLFGSDQDSMKKADEQARQQLKELDRSFETNGLYTGPINIRHAVYGLLIEAKLPWVELDVVGSKWLFEELEDPRPLLAQISAERPFIRLELTQSGDPGCVALRRYGDLWHKIHDMQVQPSSCLKFGFVSELASELRLSVDTDRASRRELRWVLRRSGSDEVLVSVPFWQYQTAGQPLQVYADYRRDAQSSSFVDLIRKLHPTLRVTGNDGRPLVLDRGRRITFDARLPPYPVVGTIEPLEVQTHVNRDLERDWRDVYQEGISTLRPQHVSRSRLIFFPQTHELREALADRQTHLFAEQGLLLTASMTWNAPYSVWVQGFDLERDVQWGMAVSLVRSPELATRCSVPESVAIGAKNLYIDAMTSDQRAVSIWGRTNIDDWRKSCEVRITVPWPAVKIEAQTAGPH
ncbi:hypothetical protein [Pelomonas sp. Root1237]|uniref:hypothetical protein n=1 Tax=Pelomonas sp. Root1237 TaxID=1736434 RepID=UPI0007160FBE|nr:hypothetical protein [Pelomonas sp. Root1237]KQV88185.1 hypothetical protein ASC91_15285 [Pelomonas sp. Root1237]